MGGKCVMGLRLHARCASHSREGYARETLQAHPNTWKVYALVAIATDSQYPTKSSGEGIGMSVPGESRPVRLR